MRALVEQLKNDSRWLKRAVVLLVTLCFLAPWEALAYPALQGGPTAPAVKEGGDTGMLLARKRRRRRRSSRARRRGRRRTRKPAPAIKRPKREKEAFPSRPAAAAAPKADAPAPAADGALRRGARVEFDGRLVQGQTAKSGAIYLFARMRSELRSMVKERATYRKEILRTVYPEEGK